MINIIKKYIAYIKRKRTLKTYMAWKKTKILPLP